MYSGIVFTGNAELLENDFASLQYFRTCIWVSEPDNLNQPNYFLEYFISNDGVVFFYGHESIPFLSSGEAGNLLNCPPRITEHYAPPLHFQQSALPRHFKSTLLSQLFFC